MQWSGECFSDFKSELPCKGVHMFTSQWAKSVEIGVFWRGGSLWAQILGRWGRGPQSINDVGLGRTLPLEVFTQRNFVAVLFVRSLNLLEKIAKSRFVPPFGGLRGNVHGSSMARWKARDRLPISANWNFYASSHGWGAMSKYWSKLCCLKGGGSLWAQISGRRGVVHQRILASAN